MKKLLVLASFLSFPIVAMLACGPAPKPKPPEVYFDAADFIDGQVDPGTAEFPACALACMNLARMGCKEAATLDGGLSCYDVCAKAEGSGRFSLRPACVAGAVDREALRACGTVRCGAR